MIVETVPLAQIEIRERTRKNITNIDSLAASIEARGLLQPIVLRRDEGALVLVAGGRRIAALRKLGCAEVDANIVASLDDELEALLAEGEENTEREPFTPSEAVAHAARIEAVETARASERRREGARKGGQSGSTYQAVGNLPTPSEDLFPEFVVAVTPEPVVAEQPAGRAADRIAAAVGMKRRTLEKAKHIVEKAEDPEAPAIVRETAQDARREMDRTGHVDGYHRRVKAAEEVAEQQAKVDSGTAVAEYLDESQALEDASYRLEFLRQIAKADTFLAFDASRIAAIGDEKCFSALASVRKQVDEFHNAVEGRRQKGLRVINGG